jgi:hypothetical protein
VPPVPDKKKKKKQKKLPPVLDKRNGIFLTNIYFFFTANYLTLNQPKPATSNTLPLPGHVPPFLGKISLSHLLCPSGQPVPS